MVKRSITGRPFKYGHILGYLQDEKLYTPATIARLIIPSWRKDKKVYTKVRHAFVGFAARKHLKTAIDGTVRVGKRTNPAWYGKTWKAEVEPADLVTPEPDMTLAQLRTYWLAKLRPEEASQEKIPKLSRFPHATRYLLAAASVLLVGSLWVWKGAESPKPVPEPMTLEQKIPQVVQKQETQAEKKQAQEYAAFSRHLLEQRRSTPKSRRLAVPYEPEQLSSWQSPIEKPEQFAAGPGQPTTVYILNARGAGLFPE